MTLLSVVLSLAAAAALQTAEPVLWRHPVQVEAVDFSKPAGGADCPAAPFQFLEESHDGNSAKVLIRDRNGIVWQVKGGPEARADAFATRLVAALGYFGEAICFLSSGTIESIHVELKRARGFIEADGSFSWASFERRDPSLHFVDGGAWKWNANPFLGTRELQGLKILVMLVSNWDNKDGRDLRKGPNTGVLESGSERIYFVTDWGQSMGAWSGFLRGAPWDCRKFSTQTAHFVKARVGNHLVFGYRGQHTHDFTSEITVEDVQWLMSYLGKVTDAQLRLGLLASGATADEEACFATALRSRIEQLRRHVVRQ